MQTLLPVILFEIRFHPNIRLPISIPPHPVSVLFLSPASIPFSFSPPIPVVLCFVLFEWWPIAIALSLRRPTTRVAGVSQKPK